MLYRMPCCHRVKIHFVPPLPSSCWEDSALFEPGNQECGKAGEVLIGLNSVCPSTPSLLTGNFLDSLTNKITCNKEMWHSAGPPALPAGNTPGPAGSPSRIAGNWQQPPLWYCHQRPGFVHFWDEMQTWNFSCSEWLDSAGASWTCSGSARGQAKPLPWAFIPSAKKNPNLPIWHLWEGKRAIQILLNKIMSAIKEQSCRCHLTPFSHRAGGHGARVWGSAIGDISYTSLGTVAK